MGYPTFFFCMMPIPSPPATTYHARLDEKKRIVIRHPQYSYYEVREFSDGHIELFPRVLADPDEIISLSTLQMMDAAVTHLTHGIASAPVDTSELLALLDDNDMQEVEEMQRMMKEQK